MVNDRLLRGRMVMAGLTQQELAKEIGMSKNTLGSRISGASSFNCDEVEKICEILGITEAKEKCEIFLPRTSQN